jgi:hypothetical protein
MLLYLTKSRPDIMAAVSFGASKASKPTTADHQQLMYIVEYIRKTPTRGHRIYAASGEPLQFYCTMMLPISSTLTLKDRPVTLSACTKKELSTIGVPNKP